jgi:hypothetical protein
VSDLHSVKVHVPGASGMGTVVTLDGEEVQGLTGVEVQVGMAEPTVLLLTLQAHAVDVSAEAATVWWEAEAVDPRDGSHHYVSAPSFPDALRELADDLETDPHQHGRVP